MLHNFEVSDIQIKYTKRSTIMHVLQMIVILKARLWNAFQLQQGHPEEERLVTRKNAISGNTMSKQKAQKDKR